MFVLFAMQLALGSSILREVPNERPLTGVTIVVDAGHGGVNLGTYYKEKVGGKWRYMVEKSLTCDITGRLMIYLREHGAEVDPTYRGSCLKPQNFRYTPWPVKANEFFSTTGEVVRRSEYGLMQRVNYAQELDCFPPKKCLFVSVHVDNDKERTEGGFVMIPEEQEIPNVARMIASEFEKAGLAKKFERLPSPIVRNGAPGYTHVTILTQAVFCETALVEVANIRNAKDRARLRDPRMRQKYAELIGRAIVRSAQTKGCSL